MLDQHTAYKYAARTDKTINTLLANFEIKRENLAGYRTFVQTVDSTLRIIKAEIKRQESGSDGT